MKFKKNQKVKAISGFYEGTTGTIIDYAYINSRIEYYVFRNIFGNWIKEEDLELVIERK